MDSNVQFKMIEHEKEINEIQTTLYEIKATLKHLTDGQLTISRLIEAKTEHSVEIKYLTHGMERVFDELKKIDGRIGKVEALLEIKEKESITAYPRGARETGYGLIETMREYWQVIAVVATALSFALSYFCGIKIQS